MRHPNKLNTFLILFIGVLIRVATEPQQKKCVFAYLRHLLKLVIYTTKTITVPSRYYLPPFCYNPLCYNPPFLLNIFGNFYIIP